MTKLTARVTAVARRTPEPGERQRDAERTKRSILEAAAEEFAASGFAGARVAGIAARAGVNKQLISYYFGGKEGLYRAIGERWREYEDENLTAERLPEALRGYALVPLQDPAGPKLLAWEGLNYEGAAAAEPGRAERLRANFGRLVATHEGELDPGFDPDMLGLMLFAAASMPSVYPQLVREVCGKDAGSPEFLRAYADQLALLAERLVGGEYRTDRGEQHGELAAGAEHIPGDPAEAAHAVPDEAEHGAAGDQQGDPEPR